MARGGLYSRYKRLAEALGVKVLDVYRIMEKGRTKDIVRLLDYTTNKVVLVDLGAPRESLSFREYVNKVLEGLKASGVEISERIAARVLEAAEKLDSASPGRGAPTADLPHQ